MPGFRKAPWGAALVSLAIVTAACGNSSSPSSSSSSSVAGTSTNTSVRAVTGTVSVACAGALDQLYNVVLGPAFQGATGDHFGGPPCAGSADLAQEILSKAISPGVFLTLGAKPIETLFPARATFSLSLANDPLVVAYSSRSRYASELDAIAAGSKPLSDLFSLMATPGFRLGRTDPTEDPEGEFFILMLALAQLHYHLPPGESAKILGTTAKAPYGSFSQMFPEDSLPTDELDGKVDAGSAYKSQALQYGLNYIRLPARLNFSDPADRSVYSSVGLDVTVKTFAGKEITSSFTGRLITLDATLVLPAAGTTVSTADEAADDAFVAFLLGPAGRSLLKTAGYTLSSPAIQLAPGVSSAAAVVPTSVLAVFEHDGGTAS